MDTLRIAVACRNASGIPDMPIFSIATSPEEYDQGIHYDKAIELAEEAGYEGPFICFDAHECTPILLVARTFDPSLKPDRD
ncbi:hypothetical protein RI828_001457 [Pseudomonas aeruginosa]|nr:hypothetical protein [Pseudomonas aeruginosa]ELF6909667.1 hypothetical protein [Pseudomonas aeruginosa]